MSTAELAVPRGVRLRAHTFAYRYQIGNTDVRRFQTVIENVAEGIRKTGHRFLAITRAGKFQVADQPVPIRLENECDRKAGRAIREKFRFDRKIVGELTRLRVGQKREPDMERRRAVGCPAECVLNTLERG